MANWRPNLRGLEGVHPQISEAFDRIFDRLDRSDSRASLSTRPSPSSIRVIREQLQVGGSAPLNVTKLLGLSSIGSGDLTFTGLLTFNPRSYSHPFAVDSSKTAVVSNLNSDKLDGADAETGSGEILRTDGVEVLTGARTMRADMSWDRYSATPANGRDLHLYRARGTSSAPTDVSASDNLGAVNAHGYRNAAFRKAGELYWDAQALGASAVQGRMVVALSDSSGSVSDRVLFQHDNTIFAHGVFVNTDHGVTGTPSTTPLEVNIASGAVTDFINLRKGGSATAQFAVTHDGFALGSTGSAAAPTFSFIGRTDQGLYSDAATRLGFAVGGVVRASLSTGGQYRVSGSGSAGAPSYSMITDTDTGMYFPAADRVGISAGGTLAGEFFSTGGVRIAQNLEVDGDLNHDGSNVGFYGASPAAQPSDPGALTDNSGGTADGTVAAVSGSGDDATINDNFADLAAKYEALRSRLQSLGITA